MIFLVQGFFTRKNLSNHMQLHENKVFSCDKCPKTFGAPQNLRSHRKYHKEPRFSCDFENCSKKFNKLDRLTIHKKIHLGQKDNPCHLCEKSYFKEDHLNRHLLNTHKELGYICEVSGCTFKSSKKEFYRSHLQSQHRSLLTIQNFIDNIYIPIQHIK